MKKVLLTRCWILLPALLLAAACRPAAAQDMDDKGLGDILDDINAVAGDVWWNKDWKFRRKVSIEDPKVLDGASPTVMLDEPDPLLLFNTGRTLDGLADLRVVAQDGTVLPCGVTNFGRDDGSSKIWFAPKLRDFQKSLEIIIYYGNPNAKPTGDAMPSKTGVTGDGQFIRVSPEQVEADTKAVVPAKGSFFKDLVSVEAERFAAEDEAGKGIFVATPNPAASGESLLALGKGKTVTAPVTLWTTAKVPSAGTWFAHIRYKAANGKNRYAPFQAVIGGKEFPIGGGAPAGGDYEWQTVKLDLPQGDGKIGLKLNAPAVPDTVLLTKDAAYRPDYRDINGPVWMRFNLQDEAVQPFYVDLFGMHTTYSATGMQGNTASYLFKDMLVFPRKIQWETEKGTIRRSELPPYAAKLANDPKALIAGGEWTPWGKALSHGSYTWFSEIRFLTGGGAREKALRNLQISYEFSTRPDDSRVFKSGVEDSGTSRNLYVRMPTALDAGTLQNMTMSFGEWGQKRFEMTESMGFKMGEGPKKLVFATMGTAYSENDGKNLLKIFDALGLNTVTLSMNGGRVSDADREKSNVKGAWTYHRTSYMFMNVFYKEDPTQTRTSVTGVIEKVMVPITDKLPGMTYDQTVEKIIADKADADYKASTDRYKKNSPWEYAHTRYNDLDDEIGPAIDSHMINKHPMFKGQWVEYLEKQGLKPDFFGAKSWDDVKAIDYTPEFNKAQERTIQVERDSAAADKKLDDDTGGVLDGAKPIDLGEPAPAKTRPDDIDDQTATAIEAANRKDVNAGADAAAKVLHERRVHYWTQRFRSYFTAMFYRQATKAVVKYFPPGIRTCVNLQAEPVTGGGMWDGALNIFDLGRLEGFNALQVEDWHHNPVNVRYAMNLMRAAARKKEQEVTALVVGDYVGQRVVANLMQGTRNYLFYLYGPVYNIGPVWAENKESQRNLGDVMRKVARTEDEILASKNRQAEAAVLVANSSETNRVYFEYPFDHERMSIYGALADANIPLDVVGEEEVIEDNALSRYKILYVCDPHVDAKAQQKIKDWVAAGGTVWSNGVGLARNEYSEPSKVMDEVFGLQSRGVVKPFVKTGFTTMPPGTTVDIPKGDVYAADVVKDVRFSAVAPFSAEKPDYKLSTGKVLATFADGKPAIVHNKFGKGQAFLNAFPAGLAYSEHYGPSGYNFARIPRGGPSTAIRGQLMSAPALAVGCKPQVKTNSHMVWGDIHDGAAQSVVYLINTSQADSTAPIEVTLTKVPKSAISGSGRPVDYKLEGMKATVNLKLAKGETDILVFKY